MIRKSEECIVASKCIRGGIGEVVMQQLLNGADEMYGKGRMFNHMTLLPGNTIGEHTHEGDNEIFYILSGSAIYNDNGTEVRVGAGDTLICNDGESHAMVNDGDEPVQFIALILYS